MERLIAYCGLDCAECPGRIATVNNDEALRAKTAAAWKAAFGFPLGPEGVNCLGCKADGVKIGHCGECGMRLCAVARGAEDCGACPEYADCAKIGEFLAQVPDARANLERRA
ncbi:MAG: DUF3795 domain-containing protein [Spirochaetes bacterium]|nr:DUF3795 domain-containing protein [Spirochaetota bacterium]MBU1079017.1 DUF3795 domain-containing protein [Spirochaetota bacterium]